MLLLQVAISVWLLQDENNQRIMNMVAGVGQPLYDYYAETNNTLRSYDKAAEWLVDSAKGGFMEHSFRILDSGHDTASAEVWFRGEQVGVEKCRARG